jgi:zinc transport system substrate-binding protein
MRIIPMKRLVVLALALASAGVTGCSQDDGGFTVATASYPLAWTVGRLVGDDATVVDVVRPGVEPHDAELTVAQTAELTEADLVVYERSLSPAVDEVSGDLDDEQRVEVSAAADLVDDDPHFWLDPQRLASVAELVAARLADADPGHADAYERRLGTLTDDLAALDDELTSGLADCTRRTVVVSHDAFGYLGLRYDLDIEAINGLSPEAEPSAGHLVELRDLAEESGTTTVFSETLAGPEMAETLAGELGLEVGVLDPVEGLADASSDEDYLSLMRQNLAALRKANDCS